MTRRPMLLSTLLLAALICCSPNPYAVPVPPDCVSHNTAKATFTNASTTNSSYDVLLDGVKVTTVAPGQTSDEFVVAALELHIVQFNFANTTTAACTPPEVYTPDQCGTTNHTCKT